MRTIVTCVLACVALLAAPQTSHATLSCWALSEGGNGHAYEPVLADVTWEQANAAATAKGGYLATITSAAENSFVYNLVTAPAYWVNEYGGPWLGGFQPAGSSEPAGGWSWVTGEAWGYTNWWWDNQPDNAGGTECYLQLHGGPLHGGAYWNDLNPTVVLHGYVIEYDSPGCVYWPTIDGGNDHCYEPVLADGTWEQANAAAEAKGGYLATVTSAAENDFVYNLVKAPAYWANEYNGPWLGGFQPAGSSEPAGGWRWVTSEPWVYTNWWWDNQPDNSGGNECYLHLEGGPLHGGPYWNDLSPSAVLHGYIVEYGTAPTRSEQTTWGRVKALYR
jgi:hypothetical protein